MTLYLITNFDKTNRRFRIENSSWDFENRLGIDAESYPKFGKAMESGVFTFKMNRLQAKRWYESLSDDAKTNFAFLSNGDICIPGSTVSLAYIE